MMEYLLDTNVLIYFVNGSLNREQERLVKDILNDSFNISILTKIEFLGWSGHTEDGYLKSASFAERANVFFIDDEIFNTTIGIKRRHKIKLVDSIICATA